MQTFLSHHAYLQTFLTALVLLGLGLEGLTGVEGTGLFADRDGD